MSENDREKDLLKGEVHSLTEELNSALKEEKINVNEIAAKLAEEKVR